MTFHPPDPSALINQRDGTASVLPYPTAGADGADAVGTFEPSPGEGSGHDARIWRQWELSLGVARPTATLQADDRPDYWLISVQRAVGAEIAAWPYMAGDGNPIRLGPGGSARIAGVTTYLTVQTTLTPNVVVSVVAVRGYPDAAILYG